MTGGDSSGAPARAATPWTRRALLAGGLVAGAGVVAPSGTGSAQDSVRGGASLAVEGSAPAPLPAFDSRSRLRHWLMLVADLSGEVAWSYTAGTVYGFRPPADDMPLAEFARPLYGYRAVIARQVLGAERDVWRVRQRGWTHYTDALTGAPIEALDNPYTGRRVRCPPMSGPAVELLHTPDGVVREAPPFPLETSEQGRPFRLGYAALGERVAVRREVYARFRTPGIDWYKLEADVTVHDAPRHELLDESRTRVPNAFLHNLVAEWQTWMEMRGVPGHILFSGLGRSVAGPEEVPAELRAALERRFPGTLEAARGWRAPGGR